MPFAKSALLRYQTALDRIENDFNATCAQHVSDFNKRVAADLTSLNEGTSIEIDPTIIADSFDDVFAKQGIRFTLVAGLGTGTVVTGLSVHLYSTIMGAVMKKVQDAIVRRLGPTAARLVTRMGASVLTVKFPPLALVIAVGGAGLTAYEVITLRARAQEDFKRALNGAITEMPGDLEKNIKLPMIAALAAMEEKQSAIEADLVARVLVNQDAPESLSP